MANRKKKVWSDREGNQPKPRERRRSRQPSGSVESRGAETLTILWTLLVTTVVGCDLGAAVTRFLLAKAPDNAALKLLSGLLLIAAALLGVAILALLPLVLRVRRTPPPRGYVVFALLVAVAPILAVILLTVR